MQTLLGLFVGLAIGATGVGGGVLLAPALILGFGLDSMRAVATAQLFSALVKVNAIAVFIWRRQVAWRVLRDLVLGGIPGVVLGTIVLSNGQTARWRPSVIASVGAIVFASAGFTLIQLWRRKQRQPETPIAGRHATAKLRIFAALIGAEVGFSSAGAGALGTIVLFRCTSLTGISVVGTDLAFGLALSGAGSLWHTLNHHVDLALLLRLLAGGIPGIWLGSFLASSVSSKALRTVVLGVSTALGLLLIFQAFFPKPIQ